jgi:hypothetical protein
MDTVFPLADVGRSWPVEHRSRNLPFDAVLRKVVVRGNSALHKAPVRYGARDDVGVPAASMVLGARDFQPEAAPRSRPVVSIRPEDADHIVGG